MVDLKFKPLDHPSDIGIIVFGSTLREIYENAACGMFSIITTMEKVEPKTTFMVKVSAEDPESLMVNWLNELIYTFESKKILLKEFKIKKLTEKQLEAAVTGEKINLKKHELHRSIKAATYNQLQLSENQAKIVFDV